MYLHYLDAYTQNNISKINKNMPINNNHGLGKLKVIVLIKRTK